jgi:hypothetical protein
VIRTQYSRPIGNIIHAYRQAPWRIQRQWLGSFLLAVSGLAIVAALYLDVTSHAAIAGRQIQLLSNQTVEVRRASADLQSRLADLTSTSAIEKRASVLGYVPVDQNDLTFVLVPGYEPPTPALLADAPAFRPSAANVPPEYTESLFAWLGKQFGNSGSILLGSAP